VKQAYKTLLMNNRYPFSIININIKSEMTDVNVHPTKQEVKFSDERAVFNTLYLAVKNCLSSSSLIYEYLENMPESQEIPPAAFENRNSYQPPQVSFDQLSFGKEAAAPQIESYKKQYDYDRKPEAHRNQFNNQISIIGQLFGTYILGQKDDVFYLIDQHAAHERIMFEYIKEKYNEKSISVQELMMPIIIELSPAEKVLYVENSLIFQNLGFEIEWFGEGTLAIRAVPILMGEPCTGEFFNNILDSIKESGSSTSSPLESIIISMACKNSIKAGDTITPEEISVLLERLMNTSQPYTCPHGRPTIITMSKYELEKKFKRIV
jgi:DNA mismatch repair protein MutL